MSFDPRNKDTITAVLVILKKLENIQDTIKTECIKLTCILIELNDLYGYFGSKFEHIIENTKLNIRNSNSWNYNIPSDDFPPGEYQDKYLELYERKELVEETLINKTNILFVLIDLMHSLLREDVGYDTSSLLTTMTDAFVNIFEGSFRFIKKQKYPGSTYTYVNEYFEKNIYFIDDNYIKIFEDSKLIFLTTLSTIKKIII